MGMGGTGPVESSIPPSPVVKPRLCHAIARPRHIRLSRTASKADDDSPRLPLVTRYVEQEPPRMNRNRDRSLPSAVPPEEPVAVSSTFGTFFTLLCSTCGAGHTADDLPVMNDISLEY
uniref:Uncharacterized protein n=1 Tax=Noctiluca scintillans TaxID=2966 RepID=A0A7S1AFS5_NOCSC